MPGSCPKRLRGISGLADNASVIVLVSVAVFFVLGFVTGRSWLAFLAVPAPIVFWLIWAATNDRGEGDDVTGPVALAMMILSLGAVVVGVAFRWFIGPRQLWRRAG